MNSLEKLRNYFFIEWRIKHDCTLVYVTVKKSVKLVDIKTWIAERVNKRRSSECNLHKYDRSVCIFSICLSTRFQREILHNVVQSNFLIYLNDNASRCNNVLLHQFNWRHLLRRVTYIIKYFKILIETPNISANLCFSFIIRTSWRSLNWY